MPISAHSLREGSRAGEAKNTSQNGHINGLPSCIGPSQRFDVRFAKPCTILPAYESAHLVLEGRQGAVSVINNSPVDVEFSIRDERFIGIVVPMEQGNMILVGEKNEYLNQFASMFSKNVEWAI